ncbi:MAG: hypothetical protein GY930_01455 [bacterium]|nr:hypothetical protein [bacterium]
MGFVRFALATKHPGIGTHEGPFHLAYGLAKDHRIAQWDRDDLSEILAWFDTNLSVPSRFSKTKSKGHYRRPTKGIAWLRDSAKEHISRMNQLKVILERYDYEINMIRETRVGYLIYEDQFQVIAEPFSDTHTAPPL